MDFSLTPEQQDLQACAEKLGRSFADEARAWDASDEAPYRDIFDRVGAEGRAGPTERGDAAGGARCVDGDEVGLGDRRIGGERRPQAAGPRPG